MYKEEDDQLQASKPPQNNLKTNNYMAQESEQMSSPEPASNVPKKIHT